MLTHILCTIQIENLKALIEVESGILLAEQTLTFEGKTLQNTQTLSSAGLKDGELIQVERHRPSAPLAANPLANTLAAQLTQGLQAALRGNIAAPSPAAASSPPLVQSRVDPEAYRQYVRSSPQMLQQLRESDPELANAAMSEDKSLLVNLLNKRATDRQRAEMERQRLIMMLERDPFNLELQQKIEAIIEQEQIDQNMEMAIEHNPESFGRHVSLNLRGVAFCIAHTFHRRVVMLYIDCEVNGTKLKAFVDSGAQQTIMSADCAKKVGYAPAEHTR